MASGKTLYQHRATKLQPPASTQKMLTALAAKLYLPSDFRFETTLAQQGDDLVFQFSGDPTLSRQQLAGLLKQAKQKGIRTIKGDILLNGQVFNGQEHATGLPWDILGVCYSAPASSLSLEHNCVQGALYSNRAQGQPTGYMFPATSLSRSPARPKWGQKNPKILIFVNCSSTSPPTTTTC